MSQVGYVKKCQVLSSSGRPEDQIHAYFETRTLVFCGKPLMAGGAQNETAEEVVCGVDGR